MQEEICKQTLNERFPPKKCKKSARTRRYVREVRANSFIILLCGLREFRSAVWAAGRLDGDFRLTERTDFGGWRCGLLRLFAEACGLVHQLDDGEQHNRHDKEIDDSGDKRAIADGYAKDRRRHILKIRLGNQTDERRNDVVSQ